MTHYPRGINALIFHYTINITYN